MSKKDNNIYHVVCKGWDCNLYDMEHDECSLKRKFQDKGCHYFKDGDCDSCSYKSNCDLIKPYSKELYNIEVKRRYLQKQIHELKCWVRTWRETEKSNPSVDVTDVVYFDMNLSQMMRIIKNYEELVNKYLLKEKELLNSLN